MINEDAFSKKMTHIGSQEQFVRVLKKCLKNGIPVTFMMPFMTKDERKKQEQSEFGTAWRFRPDFNYQDYYHHVSNGTLKYISANRYVEIEPADPSLISDDRLDFHTIYTELVHSPEDFTMYISGQEVEFGGIEEDANVNLDGDKDLHMADSCVSTIKQYLSTKDQHDIEHDKDTLAHEYHGLMADAIFDNWSSEQLLSHMDDPEIEELVKNPKETIARMERIIRSARFNESKDMATNIIRSAMKKMAVKEDKSEDKMDDKKKNTPAKKGVSEESKGAKDFKKIEKKAEKEYGSKEAGLKVAGAVKAEKDKKKGIKEEEGTDTDSENKKNKFIIELTFSYDGDDDLANKIEDELSKKAEVNEIVRTRRIMEFDYKNEAMFDAAMKTIQSIMTERGKDDYKLDSRIEEDTDDKINDTSEEEISEAEGDFHSEEAERAIDRAKNNFDVDDFLKKYGSDLNLDSSESEDQWTTVKEIIDSITSDLLSLADDEDLTAADFKDIASEFVPEVESKIKEMGGEIRESAKREVSKIISESFVSLTMENKEPMIVTFPFLLESMRWVAKSNLSEAEVIEYVTGLMEQADKNYRIIDLG